MSGVLASLAEWTALLENDTEDAEQASQVHVLKQKLTEIHQEQATRVKELIADLQAQIAELRQAVENPPEAEIGGQDRERLLQRQQELQQELQQMLTHLEAHQKQLDEGRQRDEQLRQQYQELAERSTKAIPKLRNLVRLYSKIAPIEWDYDSVNDVKGVIHHQQAREIQNFNLKAGDQKLSSAQVADFLWESIESKLP